MSTSIPYKIGVIIGIGLIIATVSLMLLPSTMSISKDSERGEQGLGGKIKQIGDAEKKMLDLISQQQKELRDKISGRVPP